MDDAETIAENWISVIIHLKGTWGGAPEAEICGVEPLTLDGRLLGYIAHISPRGHIVVSLLEGLAPVKAYSATSSLNPDLEEGLPDLLKRRMSRVLDEVEKKLGPVEEVTAEALQRAVVSDLSWDWEVLSRDPEILRHQLASDEVPLAYTPGQILLTSNWHQMDPYNRLCPEGHNGCTEDHCAVGCVALAAGQIMDYWQWPPYTPTHDYRYDWPNIPDTLWATSPDEQIHATALLLSEIGGRVGMDYCKGGDSPCASGVPTEDMASHYADFDYFPLVAIQRREDLDNDEWWNAIKAQIDNEQPAQYRITVPLVAIQRREDLDNDEWRNAIKAQIDNEQPAQYQIAGHSTVLDGYQVMFNQRMYHMNYGWAGGCPLPCCGGTPNTNTWYEVDQMTCSANHTDEYMIVNIFPVSRIRGQLSGRYDPPLAWPPYTYLSDGSITADGADFWGGQYLQFQKAPVVLTCPESAAGPLRFYGNPENPGLKSLYAYNRGDHTRGFRVDDGAIAVYQGGSILLH
jgi:hypothetical protein